MTGNTKPKESPKFSLAKWARKHMAFSMVLINGVILTVVAYFIASIFVSQVIVEEGERMSYNFV